MARYVCGFLLCLGLCAFGARESAAASPIIPDTFARQHGLTQAWFTQVALDRARARVAYMALDEGTLFVQTDRAMLQAIDAETGQTLWAVEVGKRGHPSMAPGIGRDLVAVVNGSWLYVLNRYNGKLLWKTAIDGAPGAGPALSDERAYVPMTAGMVVSYRLTPVTEPLKELGKAPPTNLTPEEKSADEARRQEDLRLRQEYVPPLFCQSQGRTLVQPLVTRQAAGEEYVAWTTDLGYLFVGRIMRQQEDRFTVRYRLATSAPIITRPTYLPPDPKKPGESGIIYATSEDGYVYAIREADGTALWRFSTAEPIIQPAVVIGQRVYVATQLGGMFCLDGRTGAEVWWAPQVLQFVAAGGDRIYATDKLQRLLVLDAKTGARLDSFSVVDLPIRLINTQTDRIYLATETGLIQCLHEVELSKPLVHFTRPPLEPVKAVAQQQSLEEELKAKAPKAPAPPKKPAAQEKPAPAAGEETPFGEPPAGPKPAAGAPPAPAAGEESPFGEPPAGPKPAAEAPPAGGQENPFAPGPANQPPAAAPPAAGGAQDNPGN